MKLATTTGDFAAYTRSQTENIDYIHQAGFRYLDYNFGNDYANRTGAYNAEWRDHFAQVKAFAGERGMTFVQAHSPMGSPIVRNEKQKQFIEDTKRCIEGCALLGIPNLVVHSGYEYGLTKDEAFERNRDFFMELLHTAEPYGVNILVENFNRMHKEGVYWIDNATDLRALIDFVDHPLFHAVWDAGHGNMQDMPQDESLRILGHHVYALHIQDNYGDSDIHLAPFFGTLNLDSLMHGLQDIGYKGYFTFESGNILLPAGKRRAYPQDERLLRAPLDLRIKAEAFLYEIGKTILTTYDCFEE